MFGEIKNRVWCMMYDLNWLFEKDIMRDVNWLELVWFWEFMLGKGGFKVIYLFLNFFCYFGWVCIEK